MTTDLQKWCSDNGLNQKQFMKLTQELEFESLEEIAVLQEQDLADVCSELDLRFAKKAKFMLAIKKLPRTADDSKEDPTIDTSNKNSKKNNNYNNNTNNNNNNNSNNNYNNSGIALPKKNVSLLFVGETGVGKSTLLASLRDFIDGVTYDQVQCTAKAEVAGDSNTQKSSEYQLSNDEWAVNIIDTPGIGDTRGFQTDRKHMTNIFDFLGNYGDFNACCILIKRGTNRLSPHLEYIVNELRSNMPIDMKDNFIVIMTRSDNPMPGVLTKAVIKRLNFNLKNVIPVNNGAYEELDLNGEAEVGIHMIEMMKKRQKQDFEANHYFLKILLKKAHAMTPYQGSKMRDLKIKRDLLREELGLLQVILNDMFELRKEIDEKLLALDAAKTVQQLNEAFEASKIHTTFNYIKTSGSITTMCTVCTRSCHVGCALSYGTNLNSCFCASGSVCKLCNCKMIFHSHFGWEKEPVFETVKHVDPNMKLKHDNAIQLQHQIKERKRKLVRKKRELELTRKAHARSIQEKYAELESIAIIGYNESFETYMKECKKAVSNDPNLTYEQKHDKIGLFDHALSQFRLLKNTISKAGTSAASMFSAMKSGLQ